MFTFYQYGFRESSMSVPPQTLTSTYRWPSHKPLAISRLTWVHIISSSSTSERYHHYYTAIAAFKLGLPLFVNLQLLHALFTPKPPSNPPPHPPPSPPHTPRSLMDHREFSVQFSANYLPHKITGRRGKMSKSWVKAKAYSYKNQSDPEAQQQINNT